MLTRKEQRLRRARQTRIRIAKQGVARLSVFRTNLHIYATVVTSDGAKVLAAASSLDPAVRVAIDGVSKNKGYTVAAAEVVGQAIAAKAKAAGVERVAFDRAGYAYHGRVKALADGARSAGLQF